MIPGYKIEKEIFRGRKRIVYRGQREDDQGPVIIRTLIDMKDIRCPEDVTRSLADSHKQAEEQFIWRR